MTSVTAARYCGFALIAALVASCDEDDGYAGDDEQEFREVGYNGTWLNGTWLNGTWLNGFNLGGVSLTGADPAVDYVEVLGILAPGGAAAVQAYLVGSELRVEAAGGVTYAGAAVAGTRIDYDIGESSKGKKFKKIRINSAALLAPGSSVWVYDIDFREETGPWKDLCRDANNQRTTAILLSDVWLAATGARIGAQVGNLTFACRGTALAKCVELGYRPWTSVGGTSLRDHHQACTRMIRADYCGEGLAHTLDGTAIHVLDQVGVQGVAPGVSYAVEAEWGPGGAVCLNSANTRLPNQALSCQLPACGGAAFSSGGLLQSGKIIAGP